MIGRRPLLVVLRALGVGDLLTGVPSIRALARAFPSHHRVLAAPGHLRPLAELAGGVDELSDTGELAPLDPTLIRPDIAVDLHGRGPRSQELLLALRPHRLIAFAHTGVPGTVPGPRWRPDEHEVHRWCRMLRESGIAADPDDLSLPIPTRRHDRSSLAGATVLHPGAGWPARRWPVDRFAAVAAAELHTGRRVVVTAGPGEEALAATVLTLALRAVSPRSRCSPCGPTVPRATRAPTGRISVLAGVDLAELASVVSHAGQVVCGDTGMAHLATAFGVPSVVLHGPVSPALWGPPPQRTRHIALWAGRSGDPHGATVDPGLLEITVADVLAALDRLRHPGRPIQPAAGRC